MADLSTTFTGIRFPNPFLLASAPPTESESQHHPGLRGRLGRRGHQDHRPPPGRQRARPEDRRSCASTTAAAALSMAKRPDATWWPPGTGSSSPTSRSTGGCAACAASSGLPRPGPGRLDHGRLRQRPGARALADADARRSRTRASTPIELNFSCPHMDRVDMGANVGKDPVLCSDVHAGRQGRRHGVPVWVKLTPADGGHRRGGGGDLPRRRRRDLVVEHVPVAAADRPRDARLRGQRGRARLVGRPGRPGDPAPVAGQDGADDRGVPGPRVLRHRRHLGASRDALAYFLLGCGTVQVATAAMLDHAIGPNVIRDLTAGDDRVPRRNADRGWTRLRRLPWAAPRERGAALAIAAELLAPGADDLAAG